MDSITSTESVALNKGGHDIVRLSLSRSSKGLVVKVKAHSSIEDFFQTLSQGRTEPVALHGRWWRPLGENPLPNVYALSTPVQGRLYSLGGVGSDLSPTGASIDGEYVSPDTLNISFLRFVGISEGEGVAFSLPTVQTMEAVQGMSQKLRESIKGFYIDLLKPFNVVITMTAQEIR
jgi:hypothetical protein